MSDHREAIAEMLAEHPMVSGYDEVGVWFNHACSCSASGDSDEWHRRHVADALLGSDVLAQIRAEARAEAWDEGRRFGQVHWASNYWPEVSHRPDVNPYRAEGSA